MISCNILVYAALLHRVLSIETIPAKCSIKFDISICMSNETQDSLKETCSNEVSVCGRNLAITYVKLEPYSTGIVHSLLRRCCGNCPSVHNHTTINDISRIPDVNSQSADIIYPVLGRNSKQVKTACLE